MTHYVNNRVDRLKGWLSRVSTTKPQLNRPTTQEPRSRAASIETSPDPIGWSDDTSTLCTPRHSIADSSLRSRTSSFASSAEDLNLLVSGGERDPLIDPTTMDTAIAMVIRARHEDQMGREDVAVQLYVYGLERLSCALMSLDRVQDPEMRQRLCRLRQILDNNAPIVEPAPGRMMESSDDLSKQLLVCLLGWIHQLLVMWLVFWGSLLVWCTQQIRDSRLPELVAGWLTLVGVWMYRKGKEHNVHGQCMQVANGMMNWVWAMDRESGFTQRIFCSTATILGAVARVAEENSSASN